MTDDPAAEGRAAREAAEQILDGLLALAREDLHDVPTEQRFDLLVKLVLRSQTNPAVLASGFVVAVERLITQERLDQGLT